MKNILFHIVIIAFGGLASCKPTDSNISENSYSYTIQNQTEHHIQLELYTYKFLFDGEGSPTGVESVELTKIITIAPNAEETITYTGLEQAAPPPFSQFDTDSVAFFSDMNYSHYNVCYVISSEIGCSEPRNILNLINFEGQSSQNFRYTITESDI